MELLENQQHGPSPSVTISLPSIGVILLARLIMYVSSDIHSFRRGIIHLAAHSLRQKLFELAG